MVKMIDRQVMETTSEKARHSPRRRMNHNLHELPDPIQRMLNAVEPGSYVRPHRHLAPPKVELFLILKGRGAVLIFDDGGEVTAVHLLAAGGETLGLEIPPGTWHSILSLEPGTIFFEVKDGPYEPITDKDFAPWAPAEGDEGAGEYLKGLEGRAREQIGYGGGEARV